MTRAAPGEPIPKTPGPPDTGIEILFVQGDQRTQLAKVDAAADFTINARVAVPVEAAPGPAILRAVGANGSPEVAVSVDPVRAASPPREDLPRTGGMGTVALVIAGVAAVLVGIAMRSRRGLPLE